MASRAGASRRPSSRRRIWLLVAAVVAAAVCALLAWIARPVSLSLALAAPRAESWLAPVLDTVVVEEWSVEVDGRYLVADLYRPAAPRGAILLVHGLSRAGRHHPELVRFARLLGRHGWIVVVPQ